MSRITRATPSELTPAQAELYRGITGGSRATGKQHFDLVNPDGSLSGPFNALLLSPALGDAVQNLGAAVRYQTALTDRSREIAILIVAAHWDSAFERMAHESVGRAAGLTEIELKRLRSGGIPALTDPYELACARATLALVGGDIDDALWAELREELAESTLFELSTLVGYYATLALQLRVFRVDESA
jgi:4-carboxymuconolactone decarboxylase